MPSQIWLTEKHLFDSSVRFNNSSGFVSSPVRVSVVSPPYEQCSPILRRETKNKRGI